MKYVLKSLVHLKPASTVLCRIEQAAKVACPIRSVYPSNKIYQVHLHGLLGKEHFKVVVMLYAF